MFFGRVLLLIFTLMINKPPKVSETLLHHSRVQPAPAICFPVHLAQLARQPFRHQSDLPADVNLGVSKCDPFRAHALKKILITQKGLLRQCIPQTYILKGMIDMRREGMLCRKTSWQEMDRPEGQKCDVALTRILTCLGCWGLGDGWPVATALFVE